MAGVRIDIRTNLELGLAGHRPLLGDLYLSAQSAAGSNPAIVLIFGGGWKSGDRSQQKVYGLQLAKAGFTCLATDHRWSTEARWPAQIDDVRTAVRWLRTNGPEVGVDPDRIAVSGNSSGGHLALMAGAANSATVPSSLESAENGISSDVKAVCAFYPPVRLAGLDDESGDTTVAELLGPGATPADYDRASPLCFAANLFPPVLLISGSDDRRVPVGHTYELQQALQAAGNRVDLHVFSGQGHAFDAELGFAQVCALIMADFFRRYV